LKACSEDTPHGAMRVSIVVAMAARRRARRPHTRASAAAPGTPAAEVRSVAGWRSTMTWHGVAWWSQVTAKCIV
jgi:hypothetical protein